MERQTKSANSAAMVDAGSVTGYAATFDRIPDSYGDVIAPGAFAKTLERWESLRAEGKFIPLLYGHSTDDPAYNIGRVVDAKEDDRGLLITAEFDAENETAQYVRKLVQQGRLYQFSFAYSVNDAGPVTLDDGADAYELRELELYEISLVQIPANQRAVVLDIKSAKAGRVLSAKNAEAIKEAINLLQSVLDGAGVEEQQHEPDGGAAKVNPAGEEPEAKRNARAEQLLAAIETETERKANE